MKKPAVKKPVVKTGSPVIATKTPAPQLPVVPPKPAPVTTPVGAPTGGGSSWNLSDPGVLLLTIVLAIAVWFLAWAGWRRLRFYRTVWQYNARQRRDDLEDLEGMHAALQQRLAAPKAPDGSRAAPLLSTIR